LFHKDVVKAIRNSQTFIPFLSLFVSRSF